MEPSSQPLATDSFSFSWLTNPRPSFDGLIDSLRSSPDDCDEGLHHHHHHQNKIHDQDFDFNVFHESTASNSLIHADEIFSDGCIMPVYPNHHSTISIPATPVSSLTSITDCSERSPCGFLKKLKESSSRVLKKSLSFFSKFGCTRNDVRVDDLDRKVKEIQTRSNSNDPSPARRTGAEYDTEVYWGEIRRKSRKFDAYRRMRNVRSCNNSPWASPPRSPPRSMDPWRHVECSIDEAILHCKRSFASK